MSRLFDGIDDFMTFDPGPALTEAGAKTMLIVGKNIAGTSWASLIEGEDSSGVVKAAIGRRSNGNLYFADGSGIQDGGATLAITSTTTWWVLAVTDIAGASSCRFHKVNVGGSSPVHVAGAAVGNGSGVVSRIKLGGDDDKANWKFAAAALFNSALTDAQIEGIATAATTQSIADLTPLALYDDSDAFTTNLINPGTFDRSAIVGTADDAEDPPGWVYGLGGGATAYALDAASGSYSITGTAASPRSARIVSAGSGSYAITGVSAQTVRGLVLAANPGSYTVTGTAGGLLTDRSLSLDSGTIAVTGIDATFVYNTGALAYVLDAASGSYTLTGVATSPLVNRVIATDPGTFVVTGSDAALLAARLISAESGTYTITGALAEFLRDLTLGADAGEFVITGQPAGLLAPSAPQSAGPSRRVIYIRFGVYP